ncbi:unnamed protein product [Effrenium voratum]|uniref:Uncharacterized protein n=1 Tax=Effrenium voratum TaxID=2562239 RepID=A0AA36N686_9DINO|nr:unnamed protein product [Effrenium voratum]CAJ1417353.1 unnamed protein product [Effrenium voratum]
MSPPAVRTAAKLLQGAAKDPAGYAEAKIQAALLTVWAKCSLAHPQCQVEAARLQIFESVLSLLKSDLVDDRSNLWMAACRVLMANAVSWSHVSGLLQDYFELARRDFDENEKSVVLFFETAASFPACSVHFFRLFTSSRALAVRATWLCSGSLLFFLGRAARLQKDRQLRRAALEVMAEVMEEVMEVLRSGDEEAKGEWELAILELHGAESSPEVEELVDFELLETQLLEVCNCAIQLDAKPCSRNHLYSYDYLDVLVNISSVEKFAERMVKAGYLKICMTVLAVQKTDESHKEALLTGQGASLEVLSHWASFEGIRPKVEKALGLAEGKQHARDRLEKLRDSKDARIRAAAQRLLFELAWLEGSQDAPAEVLARGPEAEAAYHKAMATGVAQFKSMKMVLLGEDRSGKSSVLASVTGAGWDAQMQSTHGVSASRFKLGRGNWKEQAGSLTAAEVAAKATAALLREEVTEEDEYAGALPDEMRSAKSAKASGGGGGGSSDDAGAAASVGAAAGSGAPPEKAETEEEGDQLSTLESANLPLDAIAIALQEDPDEVRVMVKDTAGQPRYYGMLAGALSKTSMPIIVFSLVRWGKYVLKDPAFEEVQPNMDLHMSRAKGSKEEESTLGQEERLFRYWLSMVKTRTAGSLGIIVGTHLDKVYKIFKEDEKAVENFLQQMGSKTKGFLKSIGLQNAFWSNEEHGLCFFPVDNSQSVEKNGVKQLQAAIQDMVQDSQKTGPHSKPQPLLYVKLLDILRADGQPPYLKVKQVAQLAAHFGLKAEEPEVFEALAFLHELGEVHFFADTVGLASEGVFTDPEMLALAQANILDCPRVVAKMTEQADLLHESAVLSAELLPELWKNLLKLEAPKAQPRSKHEPTDFKKVLVDFLVADGFLMPIGDGKFMVPSLLQRWTSELADAPPDLAELEQEDTSFKDAIAMDLGGLSVPDLFPQILSKLMQKKEMEAWQETWDAAFVYRNALQIDLPAGTLIALECPVDRPERVVISCRDFANTEFFEFLGDCLWALAEVLHEAASAVAKIFAQHVVIGPMLQQNGIHVVSLEELLAKSKGGKKPARLPVKCRTLQRPVQLSQLPEWAQHLLEHGHQDIAAAPKLRDLTATGPTEFNAVTLQQLRDLAEEMRSAAPQETVNMYQVNDQVVKPACKKHQKPYARILNLEGLQVQCFVTHAWKEELFKFIWSIEHCFTHTPEKPNFWICIFAILQSDSQKELSDQLGGDPARAPFTEALRRSNRYLVVRNDAVDVFTRIWCCWELYCAAQDGFLQSDRYIVTGPSKFPDPENWDIGKADASNLEDKRLIMNAVTGNREIYHTIIEKATLIRNHKVPEEDRFGSPARWMTRSSGELVSPS